MSVKRETFGEWLGGYILFVRKKIRKIEDIAPDHRNITWFAGQVKAAEQILDEYNVRGGKMLNKSDDPVLSLFDVRAMLPGDDVINGASCKDLAMSADQKLEAEAFKQGALWFKRELLLKLEGN